MSGRSTPGAAARPTRRAALELWINAYPWWQELPVIWLLLVAAMALGTVAAALAQGEAAALPRNLFDIPTAAAVMASALTGVRRWKRRCDRKEDVD
ncbi:putative nucleic acid-binding protein [Streptacidiphilus sp. MAP12-33]|uniref:hypothetical protein n=1 Tax=Streptacidiphilus sp. MAP12-33 TaxID=3156266 RepID=UPI0035133E8E